MAWPAVIVSQETRLSLPSRCSTTTKMVSGIKAVLGSQLDASLHSDERPRRRLHARLQHAQFVAQFVYQLLRDFRGRTFYVFGLFCLLRHVEAFNFLQVLSDRRLHLRQRHFADGLVLRLLDADQRGIA